MARTELFSRKQPGGVYTIENVARQPGSVFFVHSGTGTDGAGYGKNPDAPCATIDYAVALCTADKGDIIYVLPGHAETLAALITADMAGISIIGLGDGNDRPALTVGAVIDGISITAANVTLENLRFVTPSAAATSLINVAASRAIVRRCVFELGANVVDAVTITADGELATFENNEVIVSANGPDSWLKFEGVVDRPVVRHNLVVGSDGTNAFDDGVLDFNSVAVTNPMVYQNYFDGADVATTVIANGGSVVGGSYGRNYYSGSATDGDNVPGLAANAITAAVIATGAIDADAIAADAITAAKIAAAAIDAATFAADALQAFQDEAEDALEGENLDHLLQLDGATQVYPEQAVADSIIAKLIAKGDPATPSTYSCVTDSLEALSDKAGGFSGDGGAAQDDSVKASLDLAHTDLDAILADTGTDGVVIAAGAIVAATFGAGAIDAAAIANSAIDAATFAAGAIDAAAIAAGAIDAATFAAGAIDAAAIAAGAIDADAIADNAIDAGAIAADAITNAKIADNALAAEQFALSAGEKTTDGIVVTRATAALPQSTAANIFTVTGLVLLKRIVGYVSTVIGAAANATKLKVNSTGAGATTDICGTVDLNGQAVDSRLEITGTFANAMVATVDVPLAKVQVTEIVIPPGTIMVDCAGSDGGTGRVRWSATYVPLESGAQIVAA